MDGFLKIACIFFTYETLDVNGFVKVKKIKII